MSSNPKHSIATKEDLIMKENRTLEEIQAETRGNIYSSDIDFDDIPIIKDKQEIVDALFGNTFDHPSKIQGEALQKILTPPFKSFIGQSQNGTGKTLAFVLAMLARVDNNVKHLQCVCLVGTSVLANQIYTDYFAKFLEYYPVKVQCLFKNPPIKFNVNTEGPAQIVISTPKYFDNHIDEFDLSGVRVFVIDEADESLENPIFIPVFDMIFSRLTKDHLQILLFSASLTDRVYQFMNTYTKDYDKILVDKGKLFTPTNDHFFINVKFNERIDVLIKIFNYVESNHAFIFVQKKEDCVELQSALKDKGDSVEYINGTLSPKAKDKKIKDFINNKFNVLITTNLAARGIDVPACKLVINFDMPSKLKETTAEGKHIFEPDIENYLHRQRRTGRFGKYGKVINFVTCQLNRDLIKKLSDDPYYLKFKEILIEHHEVHDENMHVELNLRCKNEIKKEQTFNDDQSISDKLLYNNHGAFSTIQEEALILTPPYKSFVGQSQNRIGKTFASVLSCFIHKIDENKSDVDKQGKDFEKPSKIQGEILSNKSTPPYKSFVGQSQNRIGKTFTSILSCFMVKIE